MDYIVRNTLGELLKEKDMDASKIRILDPACGSGSFLIRAFDVLKEYHRQKADKYTQVNYDEILKNNIFGVDLDKQAVEIAQLNLLLKIAEKGHKLPLLEQNIKCGNSLIDDESVTGDKAFKWEEEFKNIMDEGGFDVVVGNPPYGAKFDEKSQGYFKRTYKTSQGELDSYCLFIEKAAELLKDKGYLGFIVPNTFLNNKNAKKLREYLLANTAIKKILLMPQTVFNDPTVDTLTEVLRYLM